MGEARQKAQRLGEKPVQPEYIEQMQRIAGAIDDAFNPRKAEGLNPTGFVLMVFPFNRGAEHGDPTAAMNYISNANRDEVIRAMQDQLHRFESLKAAERAKN